MRILFIAQGDSPHTLRTLDNTREHCPNATFEIFRSSPLPYSGVARQLALCHDNGSQPPSKADDYWNSLYLNPTTPYSANPALLADLLRKESYDFIHVLAMQEGAYLLRQALDMPDVSLKNAKVIYSLWGNDLYYFSRIPAHKDEILKALPLCDRLHADTERDTALARALGYAKEILPSVSAIASADHLTRSVHNNAPDRRPPSERRRLILRGTYPIRGRSFLALAAFERLPASLKRAFQLILLAPADIDLAAAYALTDSQPVAVIKQWLAPDLVLQLMTETRAIVSLNITDGTPQMYWEAAATGCYPVFSKDTGLASLQRPIGDGANIALVDPDDVHAITAALEQALTDDALVNAAAQRNADILANIQSRERMAALFHAMYR